MNIIPTGYSVIGVRGCSIFEGVKVSPCKTCRHFGKSSSVDKCMENKDCRIGGKIVPGEFGVEKSPTVGIRNPSSRTNNRDPNPKKIKDNTKTKGAKIKKTKCRFPGCSAMATGGPYCRKYRHNDLVLRRKKKFPDKPWLWDIPPAPRGVRLEDYAKSIMAKKDE